MQNDYQIEDLVHQTEDLVVYRATDRDKVPYALIRLKYKGEILGKLTKEVFATALSQLEQLEHPCLRPIVDGGQDPVDHSPWIAVRWWNGTLLPDRVQDSELSPEEVTRIQAHGQCLIDALGPMAGTVSFAPSSVVSCRSGDQIIDTFSIDYHSWFSAFARGLHPTTGHATLQRFSDLLLYLKRHSQLTTRPLLTGAPQSTLTGTAPPLTSISNVIAPPTATTPLNSTPPSSFPLKILLAVTTLILAIVGGLWFKNHKESPAPLATQSEASQKPPNSPALTPTPSPSPKNTTRPPRPRLDVGHSRIQATDTSALQSNVGKWVQITGKITAQNSDNLLVFTESTLLATLPSDSQTTAENSIGNDVSIQGFLTSPTLLEVQDQEDIKITYPLKDIYSVKDERQLRKMVGETITIEAKILDLVSSKSKKTYYLQFKKGRPELSIEIVRSRAEPALSRGYLQSLVGKTIRIKGKIKMDSRGQRLLFILSKKSQLTVVE